MTNTSCSGLPNASAVDHPVRLSATAFRRVTRPWSSVVITASPMLPSVTSRLSSDETSERTPWRHASFNTLITRPTKTNTTRPNHSLESAIDHERPGATQKYAAAMPAVSVVTIPGPAPPAHALSMMAGNSVMYGSLVCHTGSRARRIATLTTVTPMASA